MSRRKCIMVITANSSASIERHIKRLETDSVQLEQDFEKCKVELGEKLRQVRTVEARVIESRNNKNIYSSKANRSVANERKFSNGLDNSISRDAGQSQELQHKLESARRETSKNYAYLKKMVHIINQSTKEVKKLHKGLKNCKLNLKKSSNKLAENGKNIAELKTNLNSFAAEEQQPPEKQNLPSMTVKTNKIVEKPNLKSKPMVSLYRSLSGRKLEVFRPDAEELEYMQKLKEKYGKRQPSRF